MSAKAKGEPRVASKPRGKAAAGASPATGSGAADVLASAGRGALALLRSSDFHRLVATGLCAAGFVAASLRVRERVLADPKLNVQRGELATTPLPRFLSERAREDLIALPIPETTSAFKPELVSWVAYSLGRVPWVEKVGSVEIDFVPGEPGEFPARVRFSLEAAKPIARLREHGQEVLVARSRRRVPVDRAASEPRPLPRIEGLPAEGAIDRESVLDEALALVGALEKAGLPEKIKLEAVKIGPKREVWLEGTGMPRIEWGRLASTPSLTTEERVARLAGFVAKGPALETVERLALEWDDPVYVLRPVVLPPEGAGAPGTTLPASSPR